METAPAKKRGRPPIPPAQRRRGILAMRIRDGMKAALAERADHNQRSLSEEAEFLLEQAMAPKPARAGRPSRELIPGERVPMSFRVRPELKGAMDDAANRSGRSVAQEIELRLEQSFRDEILLDAIRLLANKVLTCCGNGS